MSKKLYALIFLLYFILVTFLPSQTLKATLKATIAELPDLEAYQLWIWPNNPTSREWFDIRVRVYNKGSKASPESTMNIFVGGSNKPFKITIYPLAAKDARMYTQKVFLNAPGKYSARFVVDPDNKIKESNEYNNTRQFEFRVRKADNPEYLPDLMVNKPYSEPKKPCTDDQINFRITVHNNGAVAAPASKAAIRIGGGTPVLLDVPVINPKEFKSVSLAKILPVAQKYRVVVYADYGNKIKEYDEGNNEKSNSFEVFGNCCPDLTTNNVWVWPKNPVVGEEFEIRFWITNNGKKKSPLPTTVNIFVGGSTRPYVLNVIAWGPNTGKMYQQKISLSKAAKYVARIVIDPANIIKECREDNNTGQCTFRVKN